MHRACVCIFNSDVIWYRHAVKPVGCVNADSEEPPIVINGMTYECRRHPHGNKIPWFHSHQENICFLIILMEYDINIMINNNQNCPDAAPF